MQLSKIVLRAKHIAKSAKGKSILTFAVFLFISTCFWLMMALNDDVQRDYTVNVEIVNIPDDVTFISMPPSTISVSVKDKGRSLIRYDMGANPTVTINFDNFTKTADSRLSLNEQQLAATIRSRFGSGTQIVSVKPDSISLLYTRRPGDKLPLIAEVDAKSAAQYYINPSYKVALDSVTVYSVNGIPSSIIAVRTEKVSLRNLSDSTVITAKVVAPQGMRVEPATVNISIAVEPLVQQTRTLNVIPRNVPKGTTLLTFPSMVDINYLLPMSKYNEETITAKAIVDYNQIDSASTVLPIQIIDVPEYYRSVVAVPETVEILIEH